MITKVLEYLTKLWYAIFRVEECVIMKKDELNIFSVANFFLNIVDRDSGSSITPLKLQKILYYAQGYYLALNNKELFKEDFQAWAHGPANPDIYNKYRDYKFGIITAPSIEEIPNFNDEIVNFLYSIWESFGIYDGKYLEELTHKEKPWIEARKGFEPGEKCDKIISKKSMKEYFKTKLNA